MIGQIKSIRMSGLSQTLSATISRLRLEEVAASRPFRIIGSITSSVAQIPIFISPVVAFAMFQSVTAHSGLKLDATRLFAALALITLQAQPLFFMFEVILDLSAALGVVDRIQKFLFQPGLAVPAASFEVQHVSSSQSIELQPLATHATSTGLTSSPGIKLEDVSFSWSETKTDISKVSLKVAPGQLAIITGPVAAGKSTLLKGILGEVPHATGRIQVAPGNKSWCQQSPWIMVSITSSLALPAINESCRMEQYAITSLGIRLSVSLSMTRPLMLAHSTRTLPNCLWATRRGLAAKDLHLAVVRSSV